MANDTQYPKATYGGKHDNKTRYTPDRCAEEITSVRGQWKHLAQCTNTPGYGDRNLFCKEHSKAHPASTQEQAA